MRILALAVVAFAMTGHTALAVDITTCNQGVPAGEIGVLQNDLDCSTQPASTDGVWLENNATLDLAGHTIIGPPPTPPTEISLTAPVHCRLGAFCAMNESGVTCFPGRGRCTVTSSVGMGHVVGAGGIRSDRNLLLSNVTVADGEVLAVEGSLRAMNVEVSGGMGIIADKVRAEQVTVDGCTEFGIYALRTIKGRNVTLTDNGLAGAKSRRMIFDGLVVTGNGGRTGSSFLGGGLNGGACKLKNATLSSNVADFPLGGGTAPVDILTTRRPRLIASTCDHSAMLSGLQILESWGVCALD